MGNTVFTLNDILWILTFIAALGGLAKLIASANKPKIEMEHKLHTHEDRLDATDEKLAKDLKRFESIEDTLRILCRCQLALIDHALTDNGMERMRTIRKELEDFLIDNH